MVGFPLLLIPLAVYNIIVFLMPGVAFSDPLLKLTLMSGAEWQVTLSDMLLALGILLLLLEVMKGARPGAKYVTDHLLSLIVFGAAAAEFLLWPAFGTSSYFLLVLLALTDFVSGLALRVRRRTQIVPARQASNVEPPSAELQPNFVPPSSATGASSAARPVSPESPPVTVRHSGDPDRASPEILSPGLQPSNGTPPSGPPPRDPTQP
jgi:hypothetical protein